MQLHPRESFTVTRQLQNPYITDTFYVRAVIRNAKTDAIIDTLDLDDKTGQRFTKAWQVPADVSGQGFWVSIITSVYTDSGYTTKSENYGDEEHTYLVQDRFNHNLGGVGGGGADVDYKKIRKIIKEEIASMEKPEVVTVTKEIVKEVRVPEVRVIESQKAPDMKPILAAIDAVGKKVDDKEVTELPEPFDFEPVLKNLDDVANATKSNLKELLGMKDNFEKAIKKMESTKIDVKLSDFLTEAPVKMKQEPQMDPRISKLMRTK